MKTLKDYADFLYSKGYELTQLPYEFLNGYLTSVSFIKNGYHIKLGTDETEEFTEYVETLEDGEEYEVDFKNYEVRSAFIESPLCNVSGFMDGDTSGIRLVNEKDEYYKHTLDLFEYCTTLQTPNLIDHELRIMSKRMEQLKWAKENLVPILEKCDYYADYDSFMTTKERENSSPLIIFNHPNRSELYFETDILTGEPSIFCGGNYRDLYGKNKDEIWEILLNEVFKENELAFGYLYNNDPKETVKTYSNVISLYQAIDYKKKDDNIDFNVIPDRYKDLVEQYQKIN